MRQEQSAPAPAPFLETDILSGELADLVGAGDAGKNAVGVAGLHFPQGKIGGDDGRVPVQSPFTDAGEELGGHKSVGKLCVQSASLSNREAALK